MCWLTISRGIGSRSIWPHFGPCLILARGSLVALSINTLSEGSSCQKSFLPPPALKRAGFEAATRPAAALAARIVRKCAGAVYAATFAMEGELGPRNTHLLPMPIIDMPVPQSCDCTEWVVRADIRALQWTGAGPVEERLARLLVGSWINFIGIIPKECAADICPPDLACAKPPNGLLKIVYRPFVRGGRILCTPSTSDRRAHV